MRKMICVLLLVAGMAVLVLPANAQETAALLYDKAVTGTINNTTYETSYTVQATAGEFLLISMKATEDSWLDPALILKDSKGNTLVVNDDAAANLDAVLLWEVTSDDQPTVIATRTGGATGSSEGDYTLTVNKVELLTPGSQIELEIGNGMDYTTQVLYLESAATVQINLAQASSGSDDYVFPFFEVRPWNGSEFVWKIVNLDETQYIQNISFTLNLEAGYYFLHTGLSIFASGGSEAVTLSVVSAQ